MGAILPDGSAFFIADVPIEPNLGDPICWNPWNKVVQDHRDGTVHEALTNAARQARGLPTPWNAAMAETECRQAAIK